jgi:hypothetical protein
MKNPPPWVRVHQWAHFCPDDTIGYLEALLKSAKRYAPERVPEVERRIQALKEKIK